MEKRYSDELQEITLSKEERHTTLHKKTENAVVTKSKVSALFADSDFEEDFLNDIEEPGVKEAPVKAEAVKNVVQETVKKEAAQEKSLEVISLKRSPSRQGQIRRKPVEAKRKLKPEETQAESKERPANLEPKKAEPVKGAPAKAEPAKEEPAKTVPANAEPKAAESKPKKKSSSKIILTVIIIIAACGLLFSGYKLFSILHGYKEGSDTYKEIENIVIPVAPDPEKEEAFTVDMAALKELNPDAQGYLYCKDVLSYPVVQCEDNDYYLTHLFNGEWNASGCLFIDYRIPDGLEARNCVIYGHNMNDGSMFASLYQYNDEAFYKKHKEFDVFTEGHHYIYKVFSLFVTSVDGFVYTTDFFNDEDYVNFLNTAASCCPYETEYGELTADRKVITMSTCLGNNDDTQRFVVMLIRDREVTE